MKKIYFVVALIFLPIGLVLYRECKGSTNKRIPIAYDKTYVDELEARVNPTDYNGNPVKVEKIGIINDPLAELYNYSGYGWDATPGDFATIKLHLKNDQLIEFHNFSGGWLKLWSYIKVSQASTKIKKETYGMTLDMGDGNRILILVGYSYASEPGLLTLIYITPDTAEVIFNKKIDLLSVSETERGYCLKGKLGLDESVDGGGVFVTYLGQRCKLLIEHNKLSFNSTPQPRRSTKRTLPIIYNEEYVQRFKTNEWPMCVHDNAYVTSG